jgi:hypothetical protein
VLDRSAAGKLNNKIKTHKTLESKTYLTGIKHIHHEAKTSGPLVGLSNPRIGRIEGPSMEH